MFHSVKCWKREAKVPFADFYSRLLWYRFQNRRAKRKLEHRREELNMQLNSLSVEEGLTSQLPTVPYTSMMPTPPPSQNTTPARVSPDNTHHQLISDNRLALPPIPHTIGSPPTNFAATNLHLDAFSPVLKLRYPPEKSLAPHAYEPSSSRPYEQFGPKLPEMRTYPLSATRSAYASRTDPGIIVIPSSPSSAGPHTKPTLPPLRSVVPTNHFRQSAMGIPMRTQRCNSSTVVRPHPVRQLIPYFYFHPVIGLRHPMHVARGRGVGGAGWGMGERRAAAVGNYFKDVAGHGYGLKEVGGIGMRGRGNEVGKMKMESLLNWGGT